MPSKRVAAASGLAPEQSKEHKPKPHECCVCHQRFRRSEHMKRHFRRHTSERPFRCYECGMCFSRKELHARHQKNFHGCSPLNIPPPEILPCLSATEALAIAQPLSLYGPADNASDIQNGDMDASLEDQNMSSIEVSTFTDSRPRETNLNRRNSTRQTSRSTFPATIPTPASTASLDHNGSRTNEALPPNGFVEETMAATNLLDLAFHDFQNPSIYQSTPDPLGNASNFQVPQNTLRTQVEEGRDWQNPLTSMVPNTNSMQITRTAPEIDPGIRSTDNTSSSSPEQASQIAPQSALSIDDAIWVHNLNRIGEEAPGDSVTSNKGASPAGSTSTQSMTNPAKKRVKFGGETLAHSLFPLMDGHAELSASSESQLTRRVNRQDFQQATAPISGHPTGKAPWIHANCQDHMDLVAHLPFEDQYYLYKMKKVFSFPQRSVCQELLRTFFVSVYPLLPIVDRHAVILGFERLYSHQKSSPLLFHAICFAASRYVDEQILYDAGFHSALDARKYFFSRAKLLYSNDCEMDQISVVQALILLSFWWADYTEEKDMRYWLSCAVNLALAMGMHRTIPKSLDLSDAKRNVWRRLFWILFTRDHNISVAIGQPFSLLLRNCDLPALSESDFEEHVLDNDISDFPLPEQKTYHVQAALKYVGLSIRVEKLLLALQDVRDNDEVRRVLESMEGIVSPDSMSSVAFGHEGLSIDDPSTWTQSNVCVIFLHLHYERIVMLYHRSKEKALIDALRISLDGAIGTQRTRSLTARMMETSSIETNSELLKIRADIFASAARVVRMLDSLLSRGLVRFSPSFTNTTAFQALLTLVETIVQNPTDSPQHQEAKNYMDTGLKVLKEMRNYWSAASWSYRLYYDLAQNNFKPFSTADRGSRHHSRLSSRIGSPRLNAADAFTWWDAEFLNSFQCFGETTPFATDPFSDWQIMGAGTYSTGFEGPHP